jgi:Nucleosome assembly protein (NAP)
MNDPKQIEFIFTFSPNEYLADNSLNLKKSFANVQSPDSKSQITSTVVPIQWKPGKDLTKKVGGAPLSFFHWFAFEGQGQAGDEFPESAEIAMALADEIYPHAHKMYQESIAEESDEVDEEDLEIRGTHTTINHDQY